MEEETIEKLKFSIEDNTVVTTLTQDMYNIIIGFVNVISGGNQIRFSSFITTELENSLVARYVVSQFAVSPTFDKVPDVGFKRVKVIMPDRDLWLSVGLIEVNKETVDVVYGLIYPE